MPSSLAWPGFLVALVLVAPGANAHLGAVDVEPEPASAEDPLCVPVCTVDSQRRGYTPGLVVVEDGATVSWTSADGDGHTVTENPVQDTPEMIAEGSSDYYPDACFDVHFQPGGLAEVTFDIREDGLYALEASAFDADWQRCEEAIPVAGGWLVTYHCQFHPQLQHGAILVLTH